MKSSLALLFAPLLPDGVAFRGGCIGAKEIGLFEVERAAIVDAVSARRGEFAAGRRLASRFRPDRIERPSGPPASSVRSRIRRARPSRSPPGARGLPASGWISKRLSACRSGSPTASPLQWSDVGLARKRMLGFASRSCSAPRRLGKRPSFRSRDEFSISARWMFVSISTSAFSRSSRGNAWPISARRIAADAGMTTGGSRRSSPPIPK